MIRKETFQFLTLLFLQLFWILTPISVSLSQIFFGFGALMYLGVHLLEKKKPKFPLLFFLFLLLYLSFLLPLFFTEAKFFWKNAVFKGEFSDSWLLFAFIFSSLPIEDKTKIRRSIFIGGIVLICSGIFSLFFPYRLSSFVMDGFSYEEGRRLPHLLSVLPFGINLYLPIGFQNTHLTYGGLLAIYLPVVFFNSIRIARYRSSKLWGSVWILISILGVLLLFLNQSRSILLGFIAIYLFFTYKIAKTFQKYLAPLFSFIIFCFFLGFFLFQTNWLFKRGIEDIFNKRSLENQRIWIHKANFFILKENFIWGIGSGNYETKFLEYAQSIVDQSPELYYDLFITPKSHAHFDLLEFWILGGLLGSFIFFTLIIQISKLVIRQRSKIPFYFGPLILLVAGSFQCFLLDDEVALPFFMMLSLLVSPLNVRFSKPKGMLGRFLPILFFPLKKWVIVCYLLISIFFLYRASLASVDSLFFHRTRDKQNFPSKLAEKSLNSNVTIALSNDTKEFYFKMAGCLDSEINFNKPRSQRKSPITFDLDLKSLDKDHGLESLTIFVSKRESINQDKLYRVQNERILYQIDVPLIKSIYPIQIQPEITNDLKEEPEFYDFHFLYKYKEVGKKAIYPILISPNCESSRRN